ncbi:nuclear transport factor 2 family protein [Micromonospora sp. AKA38]|uniref:nuclear transport factor 2 family protein n=1 Tax=Micromonospora sp. AKA38 TaxID=2733861 RepID=UPI0024909969|nr:nuclear transport factor 2 family protein [Micromonospora sp. AKA38]
MTPHVSPQPDPSGPTDLDLDLVRRIYAMLGSAGAAAAGATTAHPDISVYQSEQLPWGGRYTGREGFQRFAQALGSALDSRVEIEELYQAGDRVVQSGRARGVVRATGKPFEAREVHVWQIRDGLVISLDMYVETEPILEALRTD